jgi:hypothetical protein
MSSEIVIKRADPPARDGSWHATLAQYGAYGMTPTQALDNLISRMITCVIETESERIASEIAAQNR